MKWMNFEKIALLNYLKLERKNKKIKGKNFYPA
jgi:hypothetical protein